MEVNGEMGIGSSVCDLEMNMNVEIAVYDGDSVLVFGLIPGLRNHSVVGKVWFVMIVDELPPSLPKSIFSSSAYGY